MLEHLRRHDEPRLDHPGSDRYRWPDTEPTTWPVSRWPSTAAPMMPNALPSNAAGQARYCRYENSACSSLVDRQHRRRDRDVLGHAGAAAGLRVEERRLRRQRGRAGPPLLVDVRPQRLVVLHRHALSKLCRVANVREAVLAAEARVPIAGEKRREHLPLRAIRRDARAARPAASRAPRTPASTSATGGRARRSTA